MVNSEHNSAGKERIRYDCVIGNSTIIDGTGNPGYQCDIGLLGDRIAKLGDLSHVNSSVFIDAEGLCLAPGFIDVHTHDDMHVLKNPQMLSKISQGVTTVIVGNCGISASPVRLMNTPPDPMNLLGSKEDFLFPRVCDYSAAIEKARPAVNVAVLIGHTSLRNNVMARLDRAATEEEIAMMKQQLAGALADGAIGLSTGLAYASAIEAPAEEVLALSEVLADYAGIYTTHLRSEFAEILAAMEEAFTVGRHAKVPVVISHFKCAGAENWGRTSETIPFLASTALAQDVSCDCYPYAASSSTLDLKQVTGDFDIFITWSDSCPEQAGKMLAAIAQNWNVSLLEAAQRLQPAGAVYHNMDEQDMQQILKYHDSMIGSDGLPSDPHPHPRLWGTFPRVLGHYSRDLQLFTLPEAVRKMTGLPASKFNLQGRGIIAEGNYADLVLFDANKVNAMSSFENPKKVACGVNNVWVNGVLSYNGLSNDILSNDILCNDNAASVCSRAGVFLQRQNR